jgi:hypothetical protein
MAQHVAVNEECEPGSLARPGYRALIASNAERSTALRDEDIGARCLRLPLQPPQGPAFPWRQLVASPLALRTCKRPHHSPNPRRCLREPARAQGGRHRDCVYNEDCDDCPHRRVRHHGLQPVWHGEATVRADLCTCNISVLAQLGAIVGLPTFGHTPCRRDSTILASIEFAADSTWVQPAVI